VKVLARIYFSIARQSREKWEEREKHFLLPMQKMGVKIKRWVALICGLYTL
jgi:hypothetical protein